MKLYFIEVSYHYQDNSYTIPVLSNEPLTKENKNINSIAGITPNEEDIYYVSRVFLPQIKINAWDESEINEANKIIELLKN